MTNDRNLLTLAGVITWAAVAYIEFQRLITSPYAVFGMAGYLIFLLLFVSVTYRLNYRPYYRRHKIFLLLQLVIALSLLFIYRSDVAPVLLVVWAAQLADYFSRRQAILLVLLSNFIYFLIMSEYWHYSNQVINSLTFLGFQIFALATAFARVSELRAREELEQANQQLLATRIILAQSSKQEERLRIARDLHDILGHQLTALNLQLEILQHKVDPALQNSVTDTKQLAKQLLENIRSVVRDQRTSTCVDIRHAVQTLAARLPELELEVTGNLRLESAHLAEQLLLCIQEGISNAVRHGNAKKIQLFFQQNLQANSPPIGDEYNHTSITNQAIAIQIDDNGQGCTSLVPGNGLKGMRERLAPFDGHVELIPLNPGCRLAIKLETQNA